MADKSSKGHLTDEDLKYATDIAYLDLEILKDNMPEKYTESGKVIKNPSYTVRELVEMPADGKPDQDYYDKLGAGPGKAHGDQIVSLSADKINDLSDNALDWKVVKTVDMNKPGQSGFYGVVMETDDGDLIVSFRGSEPPSALQNIHQDWLKADMGLMAGDLTDQQKDVEEFIKTLKNEGYFDKYDNITFAGHSLGGNLAEHATFMAAKYGVIDRLDRTISYDGPGFTQEYLAQNKKYIELATGTVAMDHCEQSLVGGLLQRVDGINYFFAELDGKGPVQHGTENVVFDRFGNIVTENGKQTLLSSILTPFTQGLDRILSPKAGSILVTGLVGLTTVGWAIKDSLIGADGHLTTAGKVVLTGLAIGLTTLVIAVGPVAMIAATAAFALFALKVAVVSIAFVTAVIAYDFIADQIEALEKYVMTVLVPQMLSGLAKGISAVANWTVEQVAAFTGHLASAYKGLMDGLKGLFGSGPKAVATPYIEVNTHKLRQYAERLEHVRVRIRQLDGDMNSLYLTAGLLDLLSVIRANHLPSSSKMRNVIDYLETTAHNFEIAERNIINAIS